MNGLGLKTVEPQEWALQQRLAVCRSRYPFEDGHAQLAVSHPPAGLDMALRVHWRGVSLRWLCHRACLAQWLAPRLQEAAFASLPPALQLALLEVEAASFTGLVWEAVEPRPGLVCPWTSGMAVRVSAPASSAAWIERR